jgi:tRNA (cytosine38-C5)-methyltransferase
VLQDSSTRQILVETLRSIGYTTLELLLTPLQFGIPNSRLRYYLLAKKRPYIFSDISPDTANVVWRQIPGQGISWSDPRLDGKSKTDEDTLNSIVGKISIYLDEERDEEHYQRYKISDKVLEKWGRLFDIVQPSARRTCCFTRGAQFYTSLYPKIALS